MKILVYELATSSNGFETPVIYEGFEMLKMIACGFARAGHEVTAILNQELNIETKKIPAKNIIEIQNSDSKNLIEKTIEIVNSKNIDYVFPIAPDPDLVEIVKKLRLNNIEVIAPENKALEIAADKWKTYKVFKEAGLKTPGTAIFAGEPQGYPFIVKPISGVACENLFKINNENEFEKFKVFLNDDFIIQEFIEGENVSVTLFSDGKTSIPVSLNKQNLKISTDSKYMGGMVPYEHSLKEKAFKIAKNAVESIPGLKGAVGVDLILSEKPYLIEINPRPTTSMTALEKSSDLNVAESSLSAYAGKLSEIPGIEFKNIIEFSHKFCDRESSGIFYKNLIISESYE